MNSYKFEIFWIGGALAAVLMLLAFVPDLHPASDSVLDIQIYDTYFILPYYKALIALFVLLSFAVYLIRQSIDRFRNNPANIILLILTNLTVVAISIFVLPAIGGWKIYPPNMSEEEIGAMAQSGKWALYMVRAIQALLVVGILFLAIRIRKRMNTTS